MRKQIIALLLGIVLIMSIVPVIAEDSDDDSVNATNSNNKGPRPVMVKKILDNARDRNEALTERYQQLKDSYHDSKKRYELARLKLNDLDKGSKQNGKNLNASDRVELSKTFLNAAADRIIAHLERLQDVADNNNDTQVSADIQASIDAIANIKADIDAATTIDQLKEQAQKLREAWNAVQKSISKREGLIFTHKLQNLIERIENAAEKVDERLDNLESKGFNVTRARSKVNESLSLIELAKQKAIEAEAEFNLVTGAPGQDEHFKKGHKLIKDANELLRKAHRNLMDFLKDVTKHIVDERRENRSGRRGGELNQSRDGNQTDDKRERNRGRGGDDDLNETENEPGRNRGRGGDDDLNKTDDDNETENEPGRNRGSGNSDDDVNISVSANISVNSTALVAANVGVQ